MAPAWSRDAASGDTSFGGFAGSSASVEQVAISRRNSVMRAYSQGRARAGWDVPQNPTIDHQQESDMKMRIRGTAWLGVVIMTLAAMSPAAMAAKPGGGATDPCLAAGIDFPAFTYWKASGKALQIFVADATAKCSRAVATVSTSVSPAFSYPVDSTSDRGRVVWREGTTIYKADFTVSSGNVVSTGAKVAINTAAGCCAVDLSQDGRTVYFSDTGTSLATLDVSTGAVNRVYELPANDQEWYFMTASVNGSGTQLFATKYGNQSNAGASMLVRIDLPPDTAPVTQTVLRTWVAHPGYGANVFSPAVNTHDGRVAFLEYIEGSNNCTQLVVTDPNGNLLFPAANLPKRFGRWPTWVGDDVVLERRGPMDGSGKCTTTDSIARVELATNAETVLTGGYGPNGR